MKIVFLNLPNKNSVIRRYMCSYNAPGFLFPPLELMYLAAVAKGLEGVEAEVIDSIASRLDANQVLERLKKTGPDLVVFMTGFEIFGEDMQVVDYIKASMPEVKLAAIGHYPSVFPREVLENSKTDIMIMSEPEEAFAKVCERLKEGQGLSQVPGVAFKQEGQVVINSPSQRIEDLDSLSFPDRTAIDNNRYNEPFLGKPFTTILTARGCPYACTYCVRTYGQKTTFRSAENILAEIEEIIGKFGIKNFRFLDDTFTANKRRVFQICQGMLDTGIKANWTALSRLDSLDNDTLDIMKRAGCKRLYVGIESGSQKVLDYYQKKYKASELPQKLEVIRKSGISTAGFFMVGAPCETEEDFQKTLELAKSSRLDYCTIFKTVPYPGTAFFDDIKEKLDFSLFPYKNTLKDKELDDKLTLWEKRFFREYYLRPGYILKRILLFVKHPVQFFRAASSMAGYLMKPKKQARGDFV